MRSPGYGQEREDPTILDRLRQLVPAGLRRRLRALHREFVLQRAVRRIRAHDDYVPLSDRAVKQLLYGWGNAWSLQAELITELWHRAWHTRGPVLECGSGLSTVLLGIAAERQGYEVYSLEHDEAWHAKVSAVVGRLGLRTGEAHRGAARDAQRLRVVRRAGPISGGVYAGAVRRASRRHDGRALWPAAGTAAVNGGTTA